MKLGFIGLGNMGYGMALNLLKANHEVIDRLVGALLLDKQYQNSIIVIYE